MGAVLLCLSSCKGLFQYSPNEVRVEENQKGLNAKNLERLASLPIRDSFRFAVFGDTQRFYEELDEFIKNVNARSDLSFVVLNGDITDFGMNREYKWIADRLAKLRVPYITIIGNHDMLANGRAVYKEMFGEEDFVFNFGNTRFVCFNSCSREVGSDGTIPHMAWLRGQLGATSRNSRAILISHVPPFHNDFDHSLRQPFSEMLASSGVKLSIHSHLHQHSLSEPYNDGVQYLVSSAIGNREYSIISVNQENYSFEEVSY